MKESKSQSRLSESLDILVRVFPMAFSAAVYVSVVVWIWAITIRAGVYSVYSLAFPVVVTMTVPITAICIKLVVWSVADLASMGDQPRDRNGRFVKIGNGHKQEVWARLDKAAVKQAFEDDGR